MNDKQIIIDGVRVDECCWFYYENDDYKDSCYMFQNECSAQNCYYKQLKCKEQECEELKGRLKYIINENKVLKDCATDEDIDIVALKNYISTLEFSNDQLKDVIKEYKECNKYLVEENGKTYTRLDYKLLRTLTEIKKIALGVRNYLNCPSPRDVRYEMDIILQKISKCEVKNDNK